MQSEAPRYRRIVLRHFFRQRRFWLKAFVLCASIALLELLLVVLLLVFTLGGFWYELARGNALRQLSGIPFLGGLLLLAAALLLYHVQARRATRQNRLIWEMGYLVRCREPWPPGLLARVHRQPYDAKPRAVGRLQPLIFVRAVDQMPGQAAWPAELSLDRLEQADPNQVRVFVCYDRSLRERLWQLCRHAAPAQPQYLVSPPLRLVYTEVKHLDQVLLDVEALS